MTNIHYDIVVMGRVQGVWFRKFTQNKAKELNIKGFVQNTSDGTVYIEAEGLKKEIENFVKWLYSGSPLSNVSDIQITEKKFKNYKDFSIKY